MKNRIKGDEVVHLQVQKDEGQWHDVGSVQLLPDTSPTTTAQAAATTTTTTTTTKQGNNRKQLPKSVKRMLVLPKPTSSTTTTTTNCAWNRKHYYLFRHAQPSSQCHRRDDEERPPAPPPNTNLLIFLHGSGDTHVPFDALGRTMALPQTATLALSAANTNHGTATLPFGLGHSWFQEMDHATGLPLSDARQQQNCKAAAAKLVRVLEELTLRTHWIVPERIFFWGYGAGAAMALQLCVQWSEQQQQQHAATPLGGAICVAGGVLLPVEEVPRNNTTMTPILLMVGEKDESFPPSKARGVQKRYGSAAELYIEPNKGQAMIQSEREMQRAMDFLSRRLVRVTSMQI